MEAEKIQVQEAEYVATLPPEKRERFGHYDPDSPDQIEAERKLKRKIDTRMLPFMLVVYFLQFFDKTTLSLAAILGILKDANLSAGEYSWLSSIFYFGFLLSEFPSNFLMQRFSIGKYLSVSLILWGAVLCCHAASTTFASLMTVRFFLGLMEAGVTPAFTLSTSLFYDRQTMASRIGYWFCANGLSSMVGSLIGIGISRMEGLGHLKSWQWCFLLPGLLTVVVGIIAFFTYAGSPRDAKWLTQDEKDLLEYMLRDNQTEEHRTFKAYQVKECLLDPHMWLFFVLVLLTNIPNAISSFGQLIIQGIGFSSFQTILLTIPIGVMQCIFLISGSQLSTRFNSRAYVMCIYWIPMIIGTAILTSLSRSNVAGLLASVYLLTSFTVTFIIALSWLPQTFVGHTKKVTAHAVFMLGYAIGNIIAPQCFTDPPTYHRGLTITLICCVVCMFLTLFIRWALRRENKRRDALQGDKQPTWEELVDIARRDLTDRENMYFRYKL
ncbi:hypothetical protein BZG36_00787 [Bifiguratus adelaidae]|uniref:Major facilitator superfamily (MFS) profile domain-containing protein n=1 Tax=Bifiguratus adelaidae TaxID=1938954 RepID=A0A261Y6G3_9FUNG|nr:hypothetical protein BZG36_00787 [Bifiguratus adelaidae]